MKREYTTSGTGTGEAEVIYLIMNTGTILCRPVSEEKKIMEDPAVVIYWIVDATNRVDSYLLFVRLWECKAPKHQLMEMYSKLEFNDLDCLTFAHTQGYIAGMVKGKWEVKDARAGYSNDVPIGRNESLLFAIIDYRYQSHKKDKLTTCEY